MQHRLNLKRKKGTLHPLIGTLLPLITIKCKTHLLISTSNLTFQSVSDGFFLSSLFTEKLPFVELNGEKIGGTSSEIIGTLKEMGLPEKSRNMNGSQQSQQCTKSNLERFKELVHLAVPQHMNELMKKKTLAYKLYYYIEKAELAAKIDSVLGW